MNYIEQLSLLFEERLHELTAFFFQYSAGNAGFGVESMWGQVVVAALFVCAAIDDTGNLCPSDGTSTHGAGFYGDVEGAVCEVFASKGVCRGSDCLHLSMSGNVAEGLGEVVGT